MHALDRQDRALYPDSSVIGDTIIQSRDPIFHCTTALTCLLTAFLLYYRDLWMWSEAFVGISALMGVWGGYIFFNSPILVVRGPIVTLYRRGVNAGSFAFRDVVIPEGTLSVGSALFALVLASTMLGALGLSDGLGSSLSLCLSSNERFFLSMSGLWCAGAAISLSYRDLPRRKLILRGASRRPRVIYFHSRKQRDHLLSSLRALQLEEVMLRVGLGPYVHATELRDTGSPHGRKNGSIR